MTDLFRLVFVKAQIAAPDVRARRAVHPVDALCYAVVCVLTLGSVA